MARAAKTIKTTKPITPARKAARPAVAADKLKKAPMSAAGKRPVADAAPTKSQKQERAKASVAARATVTKTPKLAARVPAAPPAPKLSKEELRTQVEKLEQLVVTLRAKSRETNKAAKGAAARTLELEAQVAALEKKVTAAVSAPSQKPEPVKAPRAKRQGGKSDAPDQGTLSVGAPTPATLDKDADTAVEDLPASGDSA